MLRLPDKMLYKPGAFECEDCLSQYIARWQCIGEFRSKPGLHNRLIEETETAQGFWLLLPFKSSEVFGSLEKNRLVSRGNRVL